MSASSRAKFDNSPLLTTTGRQQACRGLSRSAGGIAAYRRHTHRVKCWRSMPAKCDTLSRSCANDCIRPRSQIACLSGSPDPRVPHNSSNAVRERVHIAFLPLRTYPYRVNLGSGSIGVTGGWYSSQLLGMLGISPPGPWLLSVTERRRRALASNGARSVAKRDREDQQWEMSNFPCPSCPLTMRLVGKERPERESKGFLLTFQCDCGQIFSARTDH